MQVIFLPGVLRFGIRQKAPATIVIHNRLCCSPIQGCP
ncbi:hypothetical protein CBM2606_A180024 [Cupriavidus taiwanensis]|nr:hypothetical protein CBM2606_A180024 [Cupriavidus taiwanensis]